MKIETEYRIAGLMKRLDEAEGEEREMIKRVLRREFMKLDPKDLKHILEEVELEMIARGEKSESR